RPTRRTPEACTATRSTASTRWLTPPRASIPREFMGRARLSTRGASPGTTRTGALRPGRAPSSTSCTSEPSRPRARTAGWRHVTPWGPAINFDGPGSDAVRDFFIHNALYWLEEYHFDGLRLDAIHAVHDTSATHIVTEIARAARAGPGRTRPIYLTLENLDNA